MTLMSTTNISFNEWTILRAITTRIVITIIYRTMLPHTTIVRNREIFNFCHLQNHVTTFHKNHTRSTPGFAKLLPKPILVY